MIRGLFFCAIACGVAAPVAAGERKVTVPVARAGAAPILPVSLNFPGHEGALTIDGDLVIRLRGMPAPAALIDFEQQLVQLMDIVPAAMEVANLVSPYAAADLQTPEAWRLTDRLAPVTASANGLYAVRDALMEYRKPRAYRPTAFSTMLVLRIDGKEESAPFSVGGSGVAAALWKVMPQ